MLRSFLPLYFLAFLSFSGCTVLAFVNPLYESRGNVVANPLYEIGDNVMVNPLHSSGDSLEEDPYTKSLLGSTESKNRICPGKLTFTSKASHLFLGYIRFTIGPKDEYRFNIEPKNQNSKYIQIERMDLLDSKDRFVFKWHPRPRTPFNPITELAYTGHNEVGYISLSVTLSLKSVENPEKAPVEYSVSGQFFDFPGPEEYPKTSINSEIIQENIPLIFSSSSTAAKRRSLRIVKASIQIEMDKCMSSKKYKLEKAEI